MISQSQVHWTQTAEYHDMTSEVSQHVNIDQPNQSVNMETVKILAVEPMWVEHVEQGWRVL